MENILDVVKAVIHAYDLPLRAFTPARAKVAIKESITFFECTLGYMHPQVLFVPEHTDLVAAIIGAQDGNIVVGEYRRGLPGCFWHEVLVARPRTILPMLLKVTIDSYSRHIPGVLSMDSFFDSSIFIANKGVPERIEFIARRPPSDTIFTYTIPAIVSPTEWKSHEQALRKRIGEINIPREWMSIDDTIAFVDSIIAEYSLPLTPTKPRRTFFPYGGHGIIIPVRGYRVTTKTRVLVGVFRSPGDEVPVVAVVFEGTILSLCLAFKNHIVGILFAESLKAKCNIAAGYTCPNTESCYVTVLLKKNEPTDVIHIMENGKLTPPSKWEQILRGLLAKVFYAAL